jgi:plasmid stabilization system protein ParE
MRLEVSTLAKNDIELIFMYGIENFGQRQAAEYKDELLDLLDLMVLQPKMGVEKQSAKKPFRTMFFHNHLVF